MNRLKFNKAVTRQNGTMEADAISKNGRSPKSHTGRGNILTGVLHNSFSMKVFFTLALTAASTVISAQKLMGNISSLKGQREVNVTIDFAGTLVNNQPEESYISVNTKEKNNADRDEWLYEWYEEMPEEAYEQFVKSLNDEIKQKRITAGYFPNAEYTIHIQVNNISPGVSQLKASNVGLTIYFVKTGQTTSFASIEYNRIWATWSHLYAHHVNRICRAFSCAGMNFGKMINKNLN